MNGNDLRSSHSSYGGDPRYLSSASLGGPSPQPPAKILLDGYHDALDPQSEGKSRYNGFNSAPPPNANDPVTMYMLTETAMGDSRNYEILSLEEVEELKKESTSLAGRIDGAKRKLALEMKLRDAARSLSKLYNPKSPRMSDEYDSSGSPKSRQSRQSLFRRSRTAETSDKSDEELAVSTRKCEALAQDLWKLESRAQLIQQRLLEHTAGVLQMTHKGLKKNAKNNPPQSPESMNGNHVRDSIDDFDDRSLYQPSGYLDGYSGYGAGHPNGSGPVSVGFDAVQDTEKKLEDLSIQLRNTILRANPDSYLDPVPQSVSNGGPVNPTATVEAHVAYIANGLGMLGTQSAGTSRTPGPGEESEYNLGEINARMYDIVEETGLSRGPSLPPPPETGSGLQGHLSYLTAGVDSLQHRLGGLLEQKGILTTQIQQQRELNNKSDAERDAHIANLAEQLANARKELELFEREGESTREELDLVNQQLDAARQEAADQQQRDLNPKSDTERDTHIADLAEQLANAQRKHELSERERGDELNMVNQQLDAARQEAIHHQQNPSSRGIDGADALVSEKESRERSEAEVARLGVILHQLQSESDSHGDVREARARAESEMERLESQLEQLRSEFDSQAEEISAVRSQADSEIARLQGIIDQLHQEADARAEDVTEARDRAEQQVSQLEEALQQMRSESDSRVREATDSHSQAQSEIARLEAVIAQSHNDMGALKEATNARTEAESNSARLQEEFTDLEGEYVRAQTELTMAKAELDSSYGTKAQRAAANPIVQKDFDDLNTRNLELAEELAAIKAKRPRDNNTQRRVETLEKELRETIDDYESMTKASIEFEKEREGFEGVIDRLRDRCEQLETQMNEERISWMGLSSPTSMSRDGSSETTSTMVLKNEFKKMMRDTRIENIKILKAEQEERRRLENLIRTLKKDQANNNNNGKPSLSQSATAL